MSDDGPPASILTDRQREFLRGELDLGERGERAARARIRKRLRSGIHDLELIVDELRDRDLEKMLNTAQPAPDGEMKDAPMWALVALLYAAAPKGDVETMSGSIPGGEADTRNRQTVHTERAVESGITEALLRRENIVADVEATIDVGPDTVLGDPEELDLPSLPRKHLDALLRAGRLDEQEYGKAIRERMERIDAGGSADIDFRLGDQQP